MKRTSIISIMLAISIFLYSLASGQATSKIQMQNGSEVKAAIVKQTKQSVFVDLGNDIVEISRESIKLIKSIVDESTTATITASPEDETSTNVLYSIGTRKLSTSDTPKIMREAMESVVIVSNPGGLGAGFIINQHGHVVTNHHVVRGEQFNTITLFLKKNGQVEKKKCENVELVAFSALYDIALLKIKSEDLDGVVLKPLPLAKRGSLRVGDSVFAIGNPGVGASVMSQTVSEGIASSINRNLRDILYIQTTAAVNPGNSGGPLFNEQGEVVGVVTLKAYFQEGIAFALPVSYIFLFLDNPKAFALSRENPNMGYRYLKPE